MAMEWVYLLILFLAVAIILVQGRQSALLQQRMAAISRLDAKLDLLLKHAGIDFDPYKNVPLEVADAIQRGKKIEAIKRYRERTGVSLKEAKDFVEDVQRRAGVGS